MSGGIEQRVFMHWKSLKMRTMGDVPLEAYERGMAQGSYHITPNYVWLLLARVHKMPVRQIKDIINAKRGRNEKQTSN